MTSKIYGTCHSEKIPDRKDLELIEVMDICSNLYLTHLLAEEILGYQCRHFADLGESEWIISILSFEDEILCRRLKQIH